MIQWQIDNPLPAVASGTGHRDSINRVSSHRMLAKRSIISWSGRDDIETVRSYGVEFLLVKTTTPRCILEPRWECVGHLEDL